MKKILFVLALAGASTGTFADSWLYGGISVGQSDFENKNDTAYSIHAGTGILPFIGVEAGYTDHGDFSVKGGDVSLSSFYLAVKPSINFGSLQVYAKAGVHRWDLKADTGSKFKDEDDYDLMWGVGADYELFGPFALGANYTNYKVNSDDIGTFNLTAIFHFL